MNIGERLKYLREQAGISGKALAEKVDIVPSQIYKIEGNVTKPSLDSLERICDALGITLSEFFAEDKPELEPDMKKLLDAAKRLTPEERGKLTDLLTSILKARDAHG